MFSFLQVGLGSIRFRFNDNFFSYKKSNMSPFMISMNHYPFLIQSYLNRDTGFTFSKLPTWDENGEDFNIVSNDNWVWKIIHRDNINSRVKSDFESLMHLFEPSDIQMHLKKQVNFLTSNTIATMQETVLIKFNI